MRPGVWLARRGSLNDAPAFRGGGVAPGTGDDQEQRRPDVLPNSRAARLLEASARPQRCFSARRGASSRGCSTAKGRPSRASGRRGRPPATPRGMEPRQRARGRDRGRWEPPPCFGESLHLEGGCQGWLGLLPSSALAVQMELTGGSREAPSRSIRRRPSSSRGIARRRERRDRPSTRPSACRRA